MSKVSRAVAALSWLFPSKSWAFNAIYLSRISGLVIADLVLEVTLENVSDAELLSIIMETGEGILDGHAHFALFHHLHCEICSTDLT